VSPPDRSLFPPPLGSLLGEIELSGPLAPNVTNASVVPLSWNFGYQYDPYNPVLTSDWLSTIGYGEYGSASFQFSTAGGQIVNWHISLSGGQDYANSTLDELATITGTGDAFSYYSSDFDGGESLQQSNATPGAWSVMGAPEIDPAGWASGLTLLAGTLAILLRRGKASTPGKLPP
jgi:hypothetical protein